MANVYPLTQTVPTDTATVVVETSNPDNPEFDTSNGTMQIPLEDGSVEISFEPPRKPKKDTGFDDNLAEELSEVELSALAEKLLQGIATDEQSRDAWLQNLSAGIDLLGLELKTPRGASVAGATPAEGVSTVDHPLLLEAVLRFQANALGELLPSDGPVKVRNDGEADSISDRLSQALEKDLNHYLTKVASEYYPDTDRMLLLLGFGGISFKKGYHDPIKRRPVIASIAAKDLIVSNTATDLEGAGRVTHRVMMRPSLLKRMQLVGAYRNVELSTMPLNPIKNPVDAKIDQVQGIAPATYVDTAEDQERELYECYCETEVPGFEHEIDGELTGLPLPYKVTLDKESRQVLEIRRNWHEDDVFCLPRNRIIAYTFIPGLGFYGIGLLNVLGNATKAVTAAWRLMLDAGMFSNFPGFLYVKSLAKQLSNQFRIPPGGGMPIDTIGNDIRASVLPLPYKDPSAVFIQLIENIANTAQRVGGTAETQIGEGKQDAPVGTTLALIEQATKLMSAVHKRLHQAQGLEFDMLKSLLMEDPEALWRHNKKSDVLKVLIAEAGQASVVDAEEAAEERHRELFLLALSDIELVPRADPNTSSQTERYLKVVAMRQMALSNPSIDMNKVDEKAFRTMGVDDPENFFKQATGPVPPSPEEVGAQAATTMANAKLLDSQTKAKEAEVKAASVGLDAKTSMQELASKEKIASLGVARELVIHNDNRTDKARERTAGVFSQQADHAHKLRLAHLGHTVQAQEGVADRAHDLRKAVLGHQVNTAEGLANRKSSMVEQALAQRHEHTQKGLDREHEAALAAEEAQNEGGEE